MNTQEYVARFFRKSYLDNKPTQWCFLLKRIINENPYLFNGDYLNKKLWMAKQVHPACSPTQYTYFKTLKGAKETLSKWDATWEIV